MTPVTTEIIKDGVKEELKMVLKGDFHIFIEGQSKPMTLAIKLEFNDRPEIVQLIQDALNIEKVGEKCLLTVHSNKQGRLDKYVKELEKKNKQQQLEFGKKDEEDDTDLDEEEEELE